MDMLAELRQRDLRIEQLRMERDAFAHNFELLKEQVTEHKHELDETRQNLLRARQEKEVLQRRQSEQAQHLNSKLAAQRRDFEETKKRLVPPHEFETMRIRLVEQLEVPYQNRFEQLQTELQLSREQFYEQRREAELMREEFEQMASVHVKEVEALRDEYELKLAEVRTRLRGMQSLAEDTTDKERATAYQRECLSLRANAKHLYEELEHVRQARENAIVEREQQAAMHARALSEEVMNARSLLLEKEKLERRCIHLDQKLQDMPHESSDQALLRMQEESASSRNKREEMENALAAERNAMNARMLEQQRDSSQQYRREGIGLRTLYLVSET